MRSERTSDASLSRRPSVRRVVLLALLLLSDCAGADFTALERAVRDVEVELDARVGVVVREIGSTERWAHRESERFLMNSSVKALICAAMLARVDAGAMTLEETLPVAEADLIAHAPLTERRVGQDVAVGELCRAAVDLSDNTAANLLITRLGGPSAVTAFLRGTGDAHTRLDRMEPELNRWAEGDPRDTTTPEAVLATLEALLLGDALTPASRAQLREWMQTGSYSGAFLRAAAPVDWSIADKSGAGDVTRTLIAMVMPPGRAPWFVGLFISEAEVDFATRNAAMTKLSAAAVAAIEVTAAD